MGDSTERTEYRVVGFRDGSTSAESTLASAKKFAEHASRHGHPEARVQQRTVTETPWEDIPA